ncbi:sugar MFS transporter [Sphingomonas flavalba]|uniref:sugar MFS transporter n=1 Tax=Sphingomonas flavalba TaxID=2559804 RepID=UPI00109D9512|nr:sugar MFS transporter [Sphingomonas flavalba]
MRETPQEIRPGRPGAAGAPQDGISLKLAMTIIGALFFVFGFVTWLNGPLITFVKLAFTLTDFEAFLVPSVFYMSYFVLALPAAWLLRRTGMKNGMVIGLLTISAGALLFGQFATHRWFGGALAGLFVIGGGLAVLQTAANPYIAILGPIETGARRIAIMGICNKTAGMLAPIAFGLLVMRGIGSLQARLDATAPAARAALLDEFAQKIYWPYIAMAVVLAVLALLVHRSPLPTLEAKVSVPPADGMTSIFRHRHLVLGVVALFMAMGAEVMAGDAIGTYGAAFGLPLEQTAYFTSFTLAAMLLGYIAGLLAIPRFVSQERYLALSALAGIAAVASAYLTTDYVSVGFVAALGFANAMMWPAIFTLAVRGLGHQTETGAAMLIMAISGGAVIPQLFAALIPHVDFQAVFSAIMLLLYLYIAYYALHGCRIAGARPVKGQRNP